MKLSSLVDSLQNVLNTHSIRKLDVTMLVQIIGHMFSLDAVTP